MNGNKGLFKRNRFNIFLALGLALGGDMSIQAASPTVILNEYNAVSADQFLKGGKSDPAFGGQPVAGNGGSWFELLVIGSNPQSLTPVGTTVDMRGWTLNWQCQNWQNLDWQMATNGQTNSIGNTPQTVSGVLQLSQDPFWQNIRSGTIITFTANNASQGGKDSDTNFDAGNGKWNVNLWAGDPALVATNGAALTTSGHWQLTIADSTGTVVSGPAGDGIAPSRSVRCNEAFKLEELHPDTANDPQTSNYKPGATSTFGQLNRWEETNMEDASVLRAWTAVELSK